LEIVAPDTTPTTNAIFIGGPIRAMVGTIQLKMEDYKNPTKMKAADRAIVPPKAIRQPPDGSYNQEVESELIVQ
jgi:hypothetical protein